jgi:hypothetical protein
MGETFDEKGTLELLDEENFEQEHESQEKGIEPATMGDQINKAANNQPTVVTNTPQPATHYSTRS